MARDLNKKATQERRPEITDPEAERVRPFDTRDLEKLPSATKDDPPYRPWWAIDWT